MNATEKEILTLSEQLTFRVHNRFVDASGCGGEACHFHEFPVARCLERSLADVVQLAAKIFDKFGRDFWCDHVSSFFPVEFVLSLTRFKLRLML